jgi:hypothetical protein
MKLRLSSKYLLAAALGLAFAAGANAQLNLFNTGVDTAPANGFDDNYFYLGTTGSIGSKPAGPGVHAVIANQPGYPFSTGNWPANNATSSWIMPTPTGTLADGLVVTNTPSIFVFTTSFFFDAVTYSLTASSVQFKAIADNAMAVYLNGTPLFFVGLDNDVFGFDTNFALSSPPLAAGNNVLDFYVTNIIGNPLLNPAGFRLEDTSILVPTGAIPEPSTYGLIGAVALLGLVMVRRIRSKSAVAA